MDNVVVRKGRPEDAEHFAQLALFTAPEFLPYLWGSDVTNILEKLFRIPGNWYSFEHTYFFEVDGEVAGMSLAFSDRQKEEEAERTGELMVECMQGSTYTELPDSRVAEIMGQVAEGEYYLQHLAMYPELRGRRIGTTQFRRIEEAARKAGCTRLVLDVETDNTEAIKLYERLECRIEAKSPVVETGVKDFEFVKMGKDVVQNSSSLT